MSDWIIGGVPRDFVINGREFTPAEGEQLNYMLSGRGGPVHIGGNSSTYKESNPFLGGANQVLACDTDDFDALVTLAGSGSKLTGYFTTASGKTFTMIGGISNDGPLESDNGNVSLEFRGKVEPQ